MVQGVFYFCIPMLYLPTLRAERAAAEAALNKRGLNGSAVVEQLLAADDARRAAQVELDSCLAESNLLAKAVGDFFKTGQKAEADAAREKSTALKDTAKRLETILRDAENALHSLLVAVPNTPHTPPFPLGRAPKTTKRYAKTSPRFSSYTAMAYQPPATDWKE